MFINRKVRNLLIVIIFFAMMILINSNSAYAGVTASNTSVTVDENGVATVTITGSNVTGTVSVSTANANIATVTSSYNWIENSSVTVTIRGVTAGTTTVTVSGKVADSTTGAGDTTYSIPISVTVRGKSTDVPDNNSSNNNSNSTGNTGTTGNTNNNQVEPKSSNSNLSNLGIRPNDFTGFRSGITTYNVTVPTDVEKIEVYATKQHEKATVTGTGTKSLKEGLNIFSVVVKAEDGTQTTYTINVTRQENTQEEISEGVNQDIEIGIQGISMLKIEDLDLIPEFETGIYQYTIRYVGTKDFLEIETSATDEDYKIEIVGNNGLVEGENIITILVEDKEGNNIATYQITVDKKLIDEEALLKQEELRKEQERIKLIIIGISVIALIILITIIVLIVRHKRNLYDDEYDEYDDENFDNNIQNTEELPREELKKEYLNRFNDEIEFDEDYEEKPKRRSKGKRFK